MTEHLTDTQVALLIEGKLDGLDSRNVRCHLAECQECAHVFIDALSVADLKAVGLLEAITPEEFQRTEKKLTSLLKNVVRQAADNTVAEVPSASKVTIGLWLEAVARKTTSSKAGLLAGLNLKLLEPIAMGGLAALMPSSAMAMSVGVNLLSSPDVSLGFIDNAAHAVERLHGFLVTIMAGNVLRLEVTNHNAKKVRLRVDGNVLEREVPDSGIVDVDIDSLVSGTQSNWLTSVVKKQHRGQQDMIMAKMEIELLDE